MKKSLKRVLVFIGLVAVMTGLSIAALAVYYYRHVLDTAGQLPVHARSGALGRFVNPFIGTGGVPWVCGHNFPGATVPFGMVRLSPETISSLVRKKALNTSGYYYGDDRILGFSHTRLSGTGATDGGHFMIAPARSACTKENRLEETPMLYRHRDEVAFPGYYAVRLPDLGVLAECTATPRVGVHRYRFQGDKPVHIRIRVNHALGNGRSDEGELRLLPGCAEIEGSARTFGSFSGRYGGLRAFFVARFAGPWTSHGVWNAQELNVQKLSISGRDVGVDLGFAALDSAGTVDIKLAISYVSIANARENLDQEAAGRDFEDILQQAIDAWEGRLGRIRLEGGTDTQKRIFYSALYHAFIMPTLFNDVNGDYLGFDKKIHRAEGFAYYTDLSLWDTFRTVHPLFTLIAPGEQRDFLVSLLHMADQGGWLPRWPSGGGYTNSMLGTPADIVIAESWLKGIRRFDIERAYGAMRSTALAPVPAKAAYSGREGVQHYLQYGYCPSDLMDEAVSRTLEYGWADHSLALLADALGRSQDADTFAAHARFYRRLWNTETQYFQPRDSRGYWFEPFKPLLLTYFDFNDRYTNDYVEGSALQWRWSAFYDPQGMLELFKSREYFVSELNDFFAQASPSLGHWHPGAYYWHGNQPDIHAAYLFNAAGRPDLTQKWVRWILDHKYSDRYDGLDGNDDGGTLSAWYVFSALGFYPVAGSDRYELGAPIFPAARLQTEATELVIRAEQLSPQNIHARRVTLNDSTLKRTWLKHEELLAGGILKYYLPAQQSVR